MTGKKNFSCITLGRIIQDGIMFSFAATICAGLLRYANIKPGEIVVDPMCGGGSIPIEGNYHIHIPMWKNMSI